MAQSGIDERDAISTKMIVAKEDADETIFVSKKFCQPDADITIVSGDDVRYDLHKKNLAISTGGFPPLEFSRTSEVNEQANLPERAYILDLLFQFVYPQRYPDIKSLKIDVLSELADAAEKYEVYGAISMCNVIMQFAISKNPVDVFVYATRYNYLDLADEAAPLVLGTPLSVFADKLPVDSLIGWIRYLASWDAIRRTWTTSIIQSMNRIRNPSNPLTNTMQPMARSFIIAPQNLSTQTSVSAPDCSQGCISLQPLLTELAVSITSMKTLIELRANISCTHCKSKVPFLAQDTSTLYVGHAKFRTFLPRQPAT
ncbi:hypothetical protein BDN72DRAFT_846886 [Pluteus cervinus]|uniref:Uncharacterized protein n=1 Tax=Pluteus cervinus TaxID=181527 RepID=A0ACD3AF25_9AGAR|nr:hypothetical protein BDN72DRAFT_846886 [Pluteus cervinus]